MELSSDKVFTARSNSLLNLTLRYVIIKKSISFTQKEDRLRYRLIIRQLSGGSVTPSDYLGE